MMTLVLISFFSENYGLKRKCMLNISFISVSPAYLAHTLRLEKSKAIPVTGLGGL
jgi:hypothetical protein